MGLIENCHISSIHKKKHECSIIFLYFGFQWVVWEFSGWALDNVNGVKSFLFNTFISLYYFVWKKALRGWLWEINAINLIESLDIVKQKSLSVAFMYSVLPFCIMHKYNHLEIIYDSGDDVNENELLKI